MLLSLKQKIKFYCHNKWGKFECCACNRNVLWFKPLPKAYLKMYKKYGCELANYETLNFKQYSCPCCGAVDRDRLSIMYLKKFLQGLSKEESFRVLKFGPNLTVPKVIDKELEDHPNYTLRTVDYFQSKVNDMANIEDMHIYENGQFDFFICSHILEHVPDDYKALRELFRILAPAGRGILMVPIDLKADKTEEDPTSTDEAENWRRFGQGDHVRKYDRSGFIRRVKAAGFEIEEWDKHRFGSEMFVRNGISEQSVLYVAKKPSAGHKPLSFQ